MNSDIFFIISKYLSRKDIESMRSVCKNWNNFFNINKQCLIKNLTCIRKEYYKNNTIMYYCEMFEDLKHGKVQVYNSDGIILLDEVYKYGKRIYTAKYNIYGALISSKVYCN